MGLGVLRGGGKLIDKLKEKASPNNPRILLKSASYGIKMFVVSEKYEVIV